MNRKNILMLLIFSFLICFSCNNKLKFKLKHSDLGKWSEYQSNIKNEIYIRFLKDNKFIYNDNCLVGKGIYTNNNLIFEDVLFISPCKNKVKKIKKKSSFYLKKNFLILKLNYANGDSKIIKFLKNNNLEDKWILKKYLYKDKLIDVNSFKSNYFNIPYLKILNNKIEANDGCNNILANCYLYDNKILIKDIATTRMYCNLKFNPIMKYIKKINNYKVVGDNMFLYIGNKKVLYFYRQI